MSLGSYAESFDSLNGFGSMGWTNNRTLPGWYASRTADTTEVTNYLTGNGSSIVGALYSFGSVGSSDRALGTLASGTPGTFAFGVRFVNDTGFSRSNIAVAYTGEQWRVGGMPPQRLAFSYRVGTALTNADARNTLSWTALPALDFVSPNTNATQTLDGNDPTNRVAMSNVLAGLVVGAGEELFLRWRDVDDAGFDDALAIDDLSVSFGEALTNRLPPGTNETFSIVTYNLKGNFAPDWTTNALQVQAIARQLIHLNPDIIALNEIPNGLRDEMTNWMTAFFPTHYLAVSPGTDGALRNGVISRYSITRSNSWLERASLTNFGYDGVFTRDLFEAQIAMPGFPQPLHVFVVHLKSGPNPDDAARRGAEALAISNFFVAGFLTTNALHPYLLAGDMNEDLALPPSGSQQPIDRLRDGTGLHLTTPLNPVTHNRFTHSIQSPGGPTHRYDYILPNTLLVANVQRAQVFRTDVLNPVPLNLNINDDAIASDHLPVEVVFNNPFVQPLRLTSIAHSNESVTLQWETVPGQSYAVERSPDLAAPGSWTTLAENLLATNYGFTLCTNLNGATQFFRVRRSGPGGDARNALLSDNGDEPYRASSVTITRSELSRLISKFRSAGDRLSESVRPPGTSTATNNPSQPRR